MFATVSLNKGEYEWIFPRGSRTFKSTLTHMDRLSDSVKKPGRESDESTSPFSFVRMINGGEISNRD